MNKELSTETLYTTAELCEQLEVPKRTMIDTINRVLPGKVQHGKTTYLNGKEVSIIYIELKKAHNLKSASTRTVAKTDLELIERFVLNTDMRKIKESNMKTEIIIEAVKIDHNPVVTIDCTKCCFYGVKSEDDFCDFPTVAGLPDCETGYIYKIKGE